METLLLESGCRTFIPGKCLQLDLAVASLVHVSRATSAFLLIDGELGSS